MSGTHIIITPITLSTTISLSDAKTGALVTGLYNGQSAIVTANIIYPPAANTVAGTAGPLDTADERRRRHGPGWLGPLQRHLRDVWNPEAYPAASSRPCR